MYRRCPRSSATAGTERYEQSMPPGWIPVCVKKTRQNKNLEPGSDSIITGKALVRLFRLHDGLPRFSAAVEALIDEVDLRHAPVRLDIPHIHVQVLSARTCGERSFDLILLSIGS